MIDKSEVLKAIEKSLINYYNLLNLSQYAKKTDLTNYALKEDIPTVTNDLTNELKANYDAAYTHSQSTHAPTNAQANADITKAEIEAKLTGNITSHTHSQYLTEHQSLAAYAPIDSPAFTTSISLGRKADTTVGGNSFAVGLDVEASGSDSHAEGDSTTAKGYASHAEGRNTTTSGEASHAEGSSSNSTTSIIQNLSSSTSNDSILTAWNSNKFSLAKGESSHVEGKDCLALGQYSHAEGYKTTASGYASHAEGNGTTASGYQSHAEGGSTTASSNYSHAEGNSTTASGYFSHAEGSWTKASGHYSHAEGNYTIASGAGSHAEGDNTIASGDFSHVQGKYNINDTENKYAHIVGNGEHNYDTNEEVRSNAYTLDWNGNAWYAGKLSQDGVPTEDKDLATKKYVDDNNYYTYPTILYDDNSLPLGYVDITTLETTKVYKIPKGALDSALKKIPLKAPNDDGTWFMVDDGSNSIGWGGYNDATITVFAKSSTAIMIYINTINGFNKLLSIKKTDGVWSLNQSRANVLTIGNTQEYTPTGDYNPATKKYVDEKVAGIVDSAPETLNTLNELATALGDDANFATTVTTQIGNKVDKVDGKGLSTNDLTNELKTNYDAAYTHSTNVHAPSNAQKNSDITKSEIEAKLTGNITTHTHSQYLTEHQDLSGYAPINNPSFTGDVIVAGKVTVGTAPTEDMDVATKKYVDGKVENMPYTIEKNIVLQIPQSSITSTSYRAEFPIFEYDSNKRYIINYNNEEHELYQYPANLSSPNGSTIKGPTLLCELNSGKEIKIRLGSTSSGADDTKLYINVGEIATTDLVLTEYSVKTLDNKYIPKHFESLLSISLGRKKGTAIGLYSSVLGYDSEATNYHAHAEGNHTIASGEASHAEGNNTVASGENSHAEGSNAKAIGDTSHAEGYYTEASGSCSHAEGLNVKAIGMYSHAEGSETKTKGRNSHAEGYSTIASGEYQHVEGKNNIEDTTNTYVHIVGNGTSDTARSNAHTLDWNGNAWYQGKLSQDGTPTEDKDLATKKYVDDNDIKMLKYVYNGEILKITLTDEQFGNFQNLEIGEYIVLDSILPEDIYKCTDTGSIWYGCILINNILFKVDSFGSLKINTIKSDNAINFYTENTYYNSSTQAGIFRYNLSLAVLNDTEQVVLVKCNDIRYYYASTEYVDEKVAGLVDSAPEALNTLNELATALGNDANFSTTVATEIGRKVDKIDGKSLSTNDLTNELKANYDAAYTHSTSAHAPSNAQANADITKAEIEAKLTGNITSHTHNQYLTSIPAEYITETELNAKGYLTEHQDISGKANVSGQVFTGTVEAPVVKATSYFYTPALVNEGDLTKYYHRLNLGYANHDYWEFHEYGGDYRFYKNTAGTDAGKSLIANITSTGSNFVGQLKEGGVRVYSPNNKPTAADLGITIPEAYNLPIANQNTLGGIKVGAGLSITAEGVLSATGGGTADSVNWENVVGKPTFATVATSGDYNDLTNKPTIPEAGIPSLVGSNENTVKIWELEDGVYNLSGILKYRYDYYSTETGGTLEGWQIEGLYIIYNAGDDPDNEGRTIKICKNLKYNFYFKYSLLNGTIESSRYDPEYIREDNSNPIGEEEAIIVLPSKLTGADYYNLPAGVYRVTASLSFEADTDCDLRNGITSGLLALPDGSIINSNGSGQIINLTYSFYLILNDTGKVCGAGSTNNAWTGELATVAISGSYNDLTDKPTIPTAYTHPATHPASMITGLSTVATSGSYADLTNKPTIPTVTNDLTNALKSNYDTAYTHSQSAHAPSNAQKNSDITKSEIEAKLTGNITTHTHSQYLTSIPSEYITEQELTSKGYATATTHEEVKTTVNQILGGAYIE